MKSRLWLLAFVPVGMLIYLCWQGKPPLTLAVAGPEKLPGPRVASPYLGAGSCAASACHNSGFTHDTKVGEYTTWITRDPHARAYEVLFHERSKIIQKNLHSETLAQNEQRCLKCHVAPEYDVTHPPAASYFKTDGVGCESCHGPAKDWINHHHLDAWQFMSATEKKKLGMTDTQSLVGRAQLCARCHVGEAGMDVDHDLIAAGHPRLNFEFSAFHAHMPRHWPDDKDQARVKGDFDTSAWVIGQLATTHASLALLAERSGNLKHPWPEFAEFDCAACHHDLKDPSPRQKAAIGKRKANLLSWGHSIALTSLAFEQTADKGGLATKALGKRLDALQTTMDAVNPNRKTVSADASAAVALLQAALDRLDSYPANLMPVQAKLDAFLAAREAKVPDSTDDRTNIYLALVALHKGRGDLPKTLRPLTPPSFDPEAIRVRLLGFKDAGASSK